MKKLLAYLVVFESISKWSILDASIPDGAINSFIVFCNSFIFSFFLDNSLFPFDNKFLFLIIINLILHFMEIQIQQKYK